jgi:hypothetical protein
MATELTCDTAAPDPSRRWRRIELSDWHAMAQASVTMKPGEMPDFLPMFEEKGEDDGCL